MTGPDPHLEPNQPFDKARFQRLLGQYLLGVAIGCVLVGLILMAKKRYLGDHQPTPPAQAVPATPGDAPTDR